MWKPKAEENAARGQKCTHHKCAESFHCSAPVEPEMPRKQEQNYLNTEFC